MNRETIKTFVLVVLVALSFLLSYILWSYQPKYEMFYDASYISEVDIGGQERGKSELIHPSHIIFHQSTDEEGASILGFSRSSDENIFYKELTTWSLIDFDIVKITDKEARPEEQRFVEVIFPGDVPASLIDNVFSHDEEVELPDWSFDRIYIKVQDNNELSIAINSIDHREQLQAKVEKVGAFQSMNRYDENHSHLQPYVELPFGAEPIYIPKTMEEVTTKTLVADQVEPDAFINALFNNPSLVKPNQDESFFTDGQRGMRIFQDGRYLEFIHPIETNDDKLEPIALMDKSIDHINEHKGWNNEYHFESLNSSIGKIEFRLHYEGVPVYDFNNISVIEQVWRDQSLYQYRRSLLHVGHLLNVTEASIRNSDEIIADLQQNEDYDTSKIRDVRLGYYLNHIGEVHSLTLEPTWFMRYENTWVRIPSTESEANKEGMRGD